MSTLRRLVWDYVPNVANECLNCWSVPPTIWQITVDVFWKTELLTVDSYMCDDCWKAKNVEERLLSQLP